MPRRTAASRGARAYFDARIRTLMCAPLTDGERRTTGIIQLDTSDPGTLFTQEDLDVLAAVAGQISVAVENARLLDTATRERLSLTLLAEAGSALASPLDLPATLAALARLVIPHLADRCLIRLLDAESGSVRCVAASLTATWFRARSLKTKFIFRRTRTARSDTTSVRTGKTELSNRPSRQFLVATTRDAEDRPSLRQVRFTAYLIVPLTARGRTLGTLALVGTDVNRTYGPAEQELAEDWRRTAQAIDNAALYQAAEAARRQAEGESRAKDLSSPCSATSYAPSHTHPRGGLRSP